jgi:MATE family multidrug resistance protein
MRSKPSYQITPHPLGSLKEIWTLAWPLIVGFLSNGMMVFVDRIMLAQYSVEAMNAAATAGSASFSFLILPMVVAGISEVFVGRFNGERAYHKMGSAVWQMIWFSVFLTPIFILISIFAPSFLFKSTQSPLLNAQYFCLMTSFGAFFCLTKGIMGFFIGQGKVKMVAFIVLIANISNIGLDYLLIYGTSFTPALGIKGAAIATITAEGVMALILFTNFMQKKNRVVKGSANFRFKFSLIMESLRIGVPSSLAHVSEYISYFIFLNWINALGEDYLTIMVILQTFYLLFFFIIEGISKGVTAVVSNFIGAKKYEYLGKTMKSTFKLHFGFVLFAMLIIFLFSPGIFSVFISKSDQAYLSNPVFLRHLYLSSIYLCLFYLFDGMVWIYVGVLTAASDSRFIMYIGTLGPWVLSLVPIYIAIRFFHVTVDQVWLYLVAYSFCFMMIYWLRYRTAPWKKRIEREAAAELEALQLPTEPGE